MLRGKQILHTTLRGCGETFRLIQQVLLLDFYIIFHIVEVGRTKQNNMRINKRKFFKNSMKFI